MDTFSTPDPPFRTPNSALLQSIFQHFPGIVAVLTTGGIVVYSNPAIARITGYAEHELVGKNFWATLFPGRLFAQIPKFISAIHPLQLLAKDVAMVLRTKAGDERVVAWSRINERETSDAGVLGRELIICFGTDLTDRLNAADNQTVAGNLGVGGTGGLGGVGGGNAGAELVPGAKGTGTGAGEGGESSIPFGPGVGNAGSIDGEIVMPIAISPPLLPGEPRGGGAIQQVHEFLVGIDERIEALETAFTLGEMANLAGIAAGLRTGAHACGLLEFSTRAEQLQSAAARGALEQVSQLVQQLVTMVRPDREI